jgi:murein DD-endopeptidase MepM/ murein hydrolase activator NlpD
MGNPVSARHAARARHPARSRAPPRRRARLPAGFNGRWTRRQWAHASLFATLAALVAAIVPGFLRSRQPAVADRARTTLALACRRCRSPSCTARPATAGRSSASNAARRSVRCSKISTCPPPRCTAARAARREAGADAAQAGTELAFDLPVNGELRTFRFDRDDTHRVELAIDGETIHEKVIERPTESRTVVISGKVGKSLFHSGRKLGPQRQQHHHADLTTSSSTTSTSTRCRLKRQVQRRGRTDLARRRTDQDRPGAGRDLHRRRQAAFRLPLRAQRQGRSTSPPKAAAEEELHPHADPVRAPDVVVRFAPPSGPRHRAPAQGRGLRASTGTPIMAAGDARVQFVGWKGGYGRAVILDHGRGYTTLYGHMSRFGGIKQGQRVPQGTVIGYVGMTGLATGPHLHYEFRINGVHRNPLSVTMPPPEPLGGASLAQFRAQTSDALARIQRVERVIYAGVAPAPKPAKSKKA